MIVNDDALFVTAVYDKVHTDAERAMLRMRQARLAKVLKKRVSSICLRLHAYISFEGSTFLSPLE